MRAWLKWGNNYCKNSHNSLEFIKRKMIFPLTLFPVLLWKLFAIKVVHSEAIRWREIFSPQLKPLSAFFINTSTLKSYFGPDCSISPTRRGRKNMKNEYNHQTVANGAELGFLPFRTFSSWLKCWAEKRKVSPCARLPSAKAHHW